jgi:hypothetical protein
MSEPRDLAQRIEHAGARIEAQLSDYDLERLMTAASPRGRRRTVRRIGFSLGAVGVVAVVLLVAGRGGGADRTGGRGLAERPASTSASPFCE